MSLDGCTRRARRPRAVAAEEGCEVEWEPLWAIEPVPFDAELVELADGGAAELAGARPRLPSGPLHDAAEMARGVPAVMLFVRSLGGVSHTKDEDTAEADLELSVRALARAHAKGDRGHVNDGRVGRPAPLAIGCDENTVTVMVKSYHPNR